jgi:hypothetical protein
MGAWVGGAGLASGDAALGFGAGRGETPDEAADEGAVAASSSPAAHLRPRHRLAALMLAEASPPDWAARPGSELIHVSVLPQ